MVSQRNMGFVIRGNNIYLLVKKKKKTTTKKGLFRADTELVLPHLKRLTTLQVVWERLELYRSNACEISVLAENAIAEPGMKGLMPRSSPAPRPKEGSKGGIGDLGLKPYNFWQLIL